MLILIVAGGPDKGRIYELLDGKDVVLGRDGDQVQLNDTKVSRQHAKLWCEGGRWYIQDLDSKHGTYRNHKKLEPNLQQPLKDGDYLQIGSTVLVLARMNGVVHQRPEMPGGDPVGAVPLADTSPTSPYVTPVPVGMSRRQQGLLIGGLAAAAALIVGVNVFTYLRANEQARVLSEQLAALQNDPQRTALQTEVRDRLIEQSERAEAVAMALAKLTPEQAALRRELAGKLEGLTAAVQSDDDAKQVAGKLDEVLLAMRAQGGQQAALADRVLSALDAQPAKVAAAVTPVSPETVQRLAAASEKLAGLGDLTEQIKQVQASLGEVSAEGGIGAALASMSQKLASFEQGNSQSRSDLLAAIDGVKQSMPADASSQVREQLDNALSKLDSALTRLDQTPTRDEITQQLAAAGKQQEVRLSQLALSIANGTDGPTLKDIQQRLETLASSVDSLKEQPGVTGSAASALADSTAQLRDQLGELANEVRDRSTLADMGKQLADLNDRLSKVDTALGAFASADQLPKLREDLAKLASALPDRKDTQQLGQQLGDLAKSLETRGNDVQTLRDQLGQVARLVQEKSDTSSLGEQLAMIQRALMNREGIAAAAMREELAEIKKLLASNQGSQADPQATAAIEKQLADIMAELKSRPDASLIKDQLEQLAAGKPAQPDPVLQQVLDAVKQRTQEQQAQQQRVDDLLAKLENEPYVNRAMLDEALAALPKPAPGSTGPAVASAVDTDLLMAQVSGKLAQFMDQRGMVTADELRRVIRAEVVASLTANADILAEAIAEQGVLGRPASDTPASVSGGVLSRTEQAYKLAFETGKPVTLGAGQIDPATGRPGAGKVLDPAAARAAGMNHWRDWYLWDDVSERMRLAREARNVRGNTGDPNVVALPAIEPPKE